MLAKDIEEGMVAVIEGEVRRIKNINYNESIYGHDAIVRLDTGYDMMVEDDKMFHPMDDSEEPVQYDLNPDPDEHLADAI